MGQILGLNTDGSNIGMGQILGLNTDGSNIGT